MLVRFDFLSYVAYCNITFRSWGNVQRTLVKLTWDDVLNFGSELIEIERKKIRLVQKLPASERHKVEDEIVRCNIVCA